MDDALPFLPNPVSAGRSGRSPASSAHSVRTMSGDGNVSVDAGNLRSNYNLRSNHDVNNKGMLPVVLVHDGHRKRTNGGGGAWPSTRPSSAAPAAPAAPATPSEAGLTLWCRAPGWKRSWTILLALAFVTGLFATTAFCLAKVSRRVCNMADVLDETVSKTAEIKRKQEALYGRLYDHVNRAQDSLWAQVEALVQRELWLRDNDRTGLVDFALESAGGRVVSTNGTPRYDREDSTLSFLGIPLFHSVLSNPAAMLQPDMSPGACWAFRGDRGVAVVRLLGLVHLAAVSLEHVPASLVPTTPSLSSAPKDIAVLALPTLDLVEGTVELGRFSYKADGPALQIFRIPVRPDRSYRYVALRIDSNHGHPDFTCVYRFRVHGSLDHRDRAPGPDKLLESRESATLEDAALRGQK